MTTDAPDSLDTRALRGPVLDVYGSWTLALQQIGETHPHALKLQGWPETQGANVVDARRRWPDIVLALCPGVDPIAKRWRSHQNRDRAVRELVEIADGCVALGVEHLVYDAEGHWECKQVADRAELAQVATQAMQQVREKHPTLRLYLTSYGWPVRVEDVGGHGNFPWRGWCDGVVYVGQTYDRGHGKLLDGERIAIASFDAAIEHRMMAPDTRRLVEIQTHHNDTAELVTVGTSTDATFWWAAGSDDLFDDEGALGWRAALALYRAGYWGALAVERFQRSRGLTGDGIVGPQTLAALETASRA